MPDAVRAARLAAALERIDDGPRYQIQGRVTRIVGNVIEASALTVGVGELCHIQRVNGDPAEAQVVGFHEHAIQLMPLSAIGGIHPGAPVWPIAHRPDVAVGDNLRGRVLDGLGRPLDGGGPITETSRYPLHADPPNPLARARITTPLSTGIRAIDGLLTLGRGQRVGIFAGSGVGKSVLMGMIARHTNADVNVIGLLGERGREVREFLEHDLGAQGLRRSVVVVSTSDQAPLVRARAALVATAIAEYFRDLGQDVLLMMDSITRVGMAWREIGLSVGEPPATKGYPPSIFSRLARLLERAGTGGTGSITGLYTVLVESDDLNEPLADAARSFLDGHIVLSRGLATERHYPAIDVLHSISRVREAVISATDLETADTFLHWEARYRQHEDLLSIGAYQPGTDRHVDTALALRERTLAFLQQSPDTASSLDATREALAALVNAGRAQSAGS